MRPGLIAIPCRPDQARHVPFFQSTFALQKPEGSRIGLYPGFFAHYNRNTAVKEALAEGLEWVFFVDDDQLFQPDALLRLLSHDLDIVGCNLLTKEPPFSPFMFFATDDRGGGFADVLGSRRGVEPVAALGLGGVLVKTHVFRDLAFPWFEVSDYLKTDDLYFCQHARKAGYQIHVDLDTVSGHIVGTSIWPEWDANRGTWVTAVRWANGAQFQVPPATHDKDMAAFRAKVKA